MCPTRTRASARWTRCGRCSGEAESPDLSLGLVALLGEAVLLHLGVELRPGDAEDPRCLRPVAAGAGQGALNQVPLQPRQRLAQGQALVGVLRWSWSALGPGGLAPGCRLQRRGQVRHVDDLAPA